MHKTKNAVALVILTYYFLILTGVLDETSLLISAGLAIAPADASLEAAKAIHAVWIKSDWKPLESLGTKVVRIFSAIYFIWNLLYFAAGIFLVLWALPMIRHAFESLRMLDDTTAPLFNAENQEKYRYLATAFRRRAARKRVESYTFLVAALACLVIAIGFMTRGHLFEEPTVLLSEATDVQSSIASAETLLSDARMSATERAGQYSTLEENLISIVGQYIESREPSSQTEFAASGPDGALTALIQRGQLERDHEFAEAASVAREYLAFATKQLEVTDHQAELEVVHTTILAVLVRLATLILILALVHRLIQLYRHGLLVAADYEAIADAVLVGSANLPEDPQTLRDLFTPRIEELQIAWQKKGGVIN